MVTAVRHPKGAPFFDNDGALLASGSVTYYAAGTTTLVDIYSDGDATSALPNPITINSAGRLQDGSSQPTAVYLSDGAGLDFKEVVKDSAGTTLYTDDNIPRPEDPNSGVVGFTPGLTAITTDTSTTIALGSGDMGDMRNANTTSNSIGYNLPAASSVSNGKSITVKKVTAANSVTITPNGADTIDGAASFTWSGDGRAYTITSDGANWHTRDSHTPLPLVQSDLPSATTDASGLVELATQAEVEAATASDRVPTLDIMHHHPGVAKVWAHVSVSGGVPTLRESYNVTSITDVGSGHLTVTIDTDFANNNWACVVAAEEGGSPSNASIESGSQAVGAISIRNRNSGGTSTDPNSYQLAGFGDQ